MAKKRFHNSDSMINADTSAMANLPQNVIIKQYPSTTGYMSEGLNDGLSGIDSQISKDNSKKKSKLQPEKF